MNDRRPATNIGELDVHVGHILTQIADMRASQSAMLKELATKADLDRLQQSMASFATKAFVEAELRAIRDELDRIRPTNLLKQLTAILAALAAFGAVAALVLSIGGWVAQVPQQPAHQSQGSTK